MRKTKLFFSRLADRLWLQLDKKEKVLLVLGLILRAAVATYVLIIGAYSITDTASYLIPAKSFLETGKLFVDGHADLCRTPVYPLFLAFCLLFGEKAMPVVAVILQQLLGLCVFFIWRKWVSDFIKNEKIRTVLEGFYLLNIVSIYYGCLLVTDFLFQLGLICMCYSLHLFWKELRLRHAFTSGIILGLLILLRPVAMYLPFALFAGIFFVCLVRKEGKKKTLISATVILLCSSMLAGSWALRNYVYTGEFTVSNIADINLFAYNAPAVEAELTGKSYYEVNSQRLAEGLTDEGLAEAKQLISDNKLLYIKKYMVGIGMQFIYPGINDIAKSIPQVDEGIQKIKAELTGSAGLVEKGINCIKYCFSDNITFLIFCIFMLIDVLFLAVLAILFICFAFSHKYNTSWYEKWMLIGIIAYLVICCAAPVGYGSYPRFRVAFIYPVVISVGTFCGAKKHNYPSCF